MKEKKRCERCLKEKKICDFAVVGIEPGTGEVIDSDICNTCSAGVQAAVDEATQSCQSVSEKNIKKKVGREKKTVKAKKGFDPENVDSMGRSLASCVGVDMVRLQNYDEKMFYMDTGIKSPLDYDEIKDCAEELIISVRGLNYPTNVELESGKSYVVFGDTNGSEVNDGILQCVENMCRHTGARPIHIGNALDNFDIVSSKLAQMDDLVLVARSDEVGRLGRLVGSNDNVTIVRERVTAGNALIRCQYYRSMYTSGSTKSAIPDDEGYQAVVIDRPLHEVHTLTKHDRDCFIISTGCSCNKFRDKARLKNKFPKTEAELFRHCVDSTAAGRRKGEMVKRWEHGFIVLHIADDGTVCPIPCRLKMVNGKWATGYMGNVVTEDSVIRGDVVEFAVGDTHVPEHDPMALGVVDKAASLILPDRLINVGDHCNSSSLNHFSMDRNEPILDTNVVDEYGMAHFVLLKMAEWARERVLIMGNHERFVEDFNKKHPSLLPLIDQSVLMSVEDTGFSTVGLKGVYCSGKSAKYIHGEMRHYGVSGDINAKVVKSLDVDTMFGHCHRPSCRAGAYGIGLLGLLDQGYNEVESSNWVHGFGVTTHYCGEAFMNTVPIIGYRTVINSQWITYDAGQLGKWAPKKFKPQMKYIIVNDDGEFDYEAAIYDMCPVVFGSENTIYDMTLWTGVPNARIGGMTPAALLAAGIYKPVHDILLEMLNGK